MGQPAVSVIIPVYNCQAWLPACLECLTAQTLEELEFLLVDDGSRDGSLALLYQAARRDARLRVLRQTHGGAAAARRLGVEHARGRYIGFADADDRMEPEMYRRLFRAAEEAGAELAMCDYNEIHGSRRSVCKMGLRAGVITGTQEIYLRCVSAVPTLWNKLYRRELFSCLEWPTPLVIGEDMALCTMLAPRVSRAALVAEGLYSYVIRPGSVMRSAGLAGAPNQVDQFLRDIAPNPAFDSENGLWKEILAARALSSLVFTRYSQGQGPRFFRAQLEKLSAWPGFASFRRSALRGRCLEPLVLAGGLSRSFSAAVRVVFLLCRLGLDGPAAAVLAACRREIERRQRR